MLILPNRSARRKVLRGLRSLRNDAGLAEIKNLVVDLETKLKAKDAEIANHIKTYDAQIKAMGDVSTELKNALTKAVTEGQELQARQAALEQVVANVRKGVESAIIESAGTKFIGLEAVKTALKEGSQFRGRIRGVVNTITEASTGSGGAGDIIIPQRVPGIITPPNRTLRVRDLLPKGRTTVNNIEFIQETGYTNSAAVVAEGAQKPESSLDFQLQSAPVRTIAHWIKATRQVLDDIPQLQSYIDTRLRYGLELVEEEELLAGDGTGAHLLGIIPQATAYDTSRSKVGDTRIDIIRRAITQLRLSEFRASAILMHPTDWEEIELTKSTTDEYIWANPQSLRGPTLWGLPVLDSTSLSEGEFLVGAFATGAQLWDRQDATVEIATENEDDFIKNLVTIRAEERLALTVYQPESFIYGDFDSDVST
jgi:HK97 family phage major capsid protein